MLERKAVVGTPSRHLATAGTHAITVPVKNTVYAEQKLLPLQVEFGSTSGEMGKQQITVADKGHLSSGLSQQACLTDRPSN